MQKTELTTTQLGGTGLEISRVGFGAWAIGGGGWEFGWGGQEEEESVAAIHRALELGINWIDSAAAYGFGHSEEVVGRALDGLAEDERPFVFTKASLVDRTVEDEPLPFAEREGIGVIVYSSMGSGLLTGAIVGFRRSDQVDPIVGAANLELGDDDVATIEGRL